MHYQPLGGIVLVHPVAQMFNFRVLTPTGRDVATLTLSLAAALLMLLQSYPTC